MLQLFLINYVMLMFFAQLDHIDQFVTDACSLLLPCAFNVHEILCLSQFLVWSLSWGFIYTYAETKKKGSKVEAEGSGITFHYRRSRARKCSSSQFSRAPACKEIDKESFNHFSVFTLKTFHELSVIIILFQRNRPSVLIEVSYHYAFQLFILNANTTNMSAAKQVNIWHSYTNL